MKIFLDTAEIDEIRQAARWGVLDGVTTNPSLYAKVGGSYDDILAEVCRITPGPVSAEVIADDVEGMLSEGRHFAKIAPNIVVKVAMSENGLEAISRFADEGIKTNCTLIFSANQGLLAAKAGASLLSPFVGRLDDINEDGMTCVRELVEHRRDPRARRGGPGGVDPPSAPRHPGRPGRRPDRDAAVQDPADDDPPPADRLGHRPLQGRLGQGPRRSRRQGLRPPSLPRPRADGLPGAPNRLNRPWTALGRGRQGRARASVRDSSRAERGSG